MSIRRQLGQKIRELREKMHLTQQGLAELVMIESPSYLSKIERGLASPSYELLDRIAKAMHIRIKDLFDTVPYKPGMASLRYQDKWMLRFRSLLKGCRESDIKLAYGVVRKVLQKSK